VKDVIKAFINNPNIDVENIEEFQKTEPIDFDDHALELIPEAYLDEKEPSLDEIKESIDVYIRKMISFMISHKKEEYFRKEVISPVFYRSPIKKKSYQFTEIPITEIFKTPLKTGDFHASSKLDEGKIPLISCSAENEGVEGYFDIPLENTYKNAVTIASDGQPLASFYHYYPFAAKDNVIVGIPKKKYRFTTLIFIVTELNRLRWRFSYGRKCYENKINKIKIFLPTTEDGEIDEDFIEYLVKSCSAWEILLRLFPKE